MMMSDDEQAARIVAAVLDAYSLCGVTEATVWQHSSRKRLHGARKNYSNDMTGEVVATMAWLLHTRLCWTVTEIGTYLRRDHSTIIYHLGRGRPKIWQASGGTGAADMWEVRRLLWAELNRSTPLRALLPFPRGVAPPWPEKASERGVCSP